MAPLKKIDFEAEKQQTIERMRAKIGMKVPLSHYFVRGEQPVLLAVDGEHAMVKFSNGTIVVNVPVGLLADDSGYWR